MSGETILGFRCNDFVIMAACGTAAFYYIKFQDNDDKIFKLDSHKMMALAGENGARNAFASFVSCNLALNTVRQHGRPCTTASTAAFMRQTLADAIRDEDGAYAVNSLLAGYDLPTSQYDDAPAAAHLYHMDYLGTMHEVPFTAHGYGTSFVVAMLDRHWRPNLTPQEGIDLMQQCCDEVRKRIVLAHDKFVCKVVTAKGVEVVPTVH